MEKTKVSVVVSGGYVEGASVESKDQSNLVVASGTTDVNGQVNLTINNAGDYAAHGSKMLPDGLYMGVTLFSTDPSGTTNITITLNKI